MEPRPGTVWASTTAAEAGTHSGGAGGWMALVLLAVLLGMAVLIVAIRQRSRRNRDDHRGGR